MRGSQVAKKSARAAKGLAAIGEAAELEAILAKDEGAWTSFVQRNDPKLREVVRHATEAMCPLRADQVDDVMGDFWLSVTEDDSKMLRSFKPRRGSSLFAWLTFHVARVANDHVTRILAEPEFVPFDEAKHVRARAPSRGATPILITGGVVPPDEIVAHGNHPLARLDDAERLARVGEIIATLLSRNTPKHPL